MYTVTTRRDWLRRLACLLGRLLRCCCCRPAVKQCQPASETDHLRHDVRPTSSCAVLQPIGTCICKILLCLGWYPVDHLLQGWPGVAYNYSTRHISDGQPGAARAETTSRDLFVDWSTANDRSSRDMCYRAWPAARVAPLRSRSAPLRNDAASKRSALRDDEMRFLGVGVHRCVRLLTRSCPHNHAPAVLGADTSCPPAQTQAVPRLVR